ncbi:MAG: phosphoglycerate kinase [Rickettsiales bacterium]|nr:phosphoglycerate kinase [Rickettsiales bacterium]
MHLNQLSPDGKTVLLRVDLNVPMQTGRVTDATRILRVLPTIRWLATRGAKVVLLSHFGRPKGEYNPSMSLAPLVDALQAYLPEHEVRFGVDCIGAAAAEAVRSAKAGDVVLLENLRFHAEEENGDALFARQIAALGDVYVNDAFSCSHRPHASIFHLPKLLPSFCGLAMQEEIETLESLFSAPERPLAAIVGGAKVSTKLALLEHLLEKVDYLMIGGAMANTFLCAQGYHLGASLYEAEMLETARAILSKAAEKNCRLMLPVDLVVTQTFSAHAPCTLVGVDAVPATAMALDIGPDSLIDYAAALKTCRTLVWNGPLGAFETAPFDNATVFLARVAARLSADGQLKSVAGGGDTLSALAYAGVAEQFSYRSTAGGAFLEWLEGKALPGVEALRRVIAA